MREVAKDVFLLGGFPPGAVNVYVIRSGERWLLVDTGYRFTRRRILRQLPGELEAILITHAHPDHAGAAHAVASETGAPVWSSTGDADAIEGKAPKPFPEAHRGNLIIRLEEPAWRDFHPVSRRLEEGEEIAGFQVLSLPGHTPGQIGLWRQSDRTALCADTLRNISFLTGRPGLYEMPELFTVDPTEARRTIRKLSELEPTTVLFGHGLPLADPAKLKAFSEALRVEQVGVPVGAAA